MGCGIAPSGTCTSFQRVNEKELEENFVFQLTQQELQNELDASSERSRLVFSSKACMDDARISVRNPVQLTSGARVDHRWPPSAARGVVACNIGRRESAAAHRYYLLSFDIRQYARRSADAGW